jgi:hypothetical protein
MTIALRPLLTSKGKLKMFRLIAIGAALGALLVLPASGQNIPTRSTTVSASSGVVAAATATATLPAVTGSSNYLCGFSVSSLGATAATTVQVTVTGLNGGTQTYIYAVVAGATTKNADLIVNFSNCIQSANPGQAITVSMSHAGLRQHAGDHQCMGPEFLRTEGDFRNETKQD